MADESQENAPANDLQAPVEEQKQDAQPAEVVQPEPEQLFYGFPLSLLSANDIDPEILGELPEDIREAVLGPLQE